MIPLNSKDLTPLDPMDISHHSLFTNLQGNILKGHGRDHTTHIFVHFDAKREKAVQKWLKHFAEEHVTCFQKQLKDRELFKRNGINGGLFVSVFLTKAGYEYLGFTDVNQQLKDPGFTSGMKKRVGENNDPAVNKWERGFRDEIHIMVLLADNDLRRMGEMAAELLKALEKFSRICSVEYGHAIRNANGDGIEHFGYVDGVSQPLFLKDDVDNYMAFHNTTPENATFNPTADKSLVLIKDPYAPASNTDSFGSYFVFRKLEQNVKGFKRREEEIGRKFFPNPDDEEKRELIGAYLVGRFEDGTPVVLNDGDRLIGSGNINNFTYTAPFKDPSGGRCPHFAHIRKTNPRRDNGDKSHAMARRGIPFGHRAIDTALGIDPTPHQMPEGGVGLLFMSYQASIKDQFETIQREANTSHGNAGIDPIIGQSAKGSGRNYDFPNQYDDPDAGTTTEAFKQFVTMKGGEYFFAPSLSFLENIDTILITKENENATHDAVGLPGL